MKTFTFTDRETYLAQRAEWKAYYAKVSSDIRLANYAIKAAHRQSTNGVIDIRLYWDLWDARAKAHEALELLKEAKINAAQQYARRITNEATM